MNSTASGATENRTAINVFVAEPLAAPTISAIIISYNTRDMTLDCVRTFLDNVAEMPAEAVEVFVVDNASTDGSADAIRDAFPQPHVHVIANRENAGFGVANNQAMERATGEFFLLLNSDAFPKPGAVSALIDALRVRPDVGVIGPRLLNRDGSLQPSWNEYPSPRLAWENHLYLSSLRNKLTRGASGLTEPKAGENGLAILKNYFLSGACLLVRRAAYEQIGGFDPRFFFYYEEADWESRMERAGWRIAYAPHAETRHLHGTSGGKNRLQFTVSAFTGRDYFVWKHHGLGGLLNYRAAVSSGFLVGLLRFGPPALLSKDKDSVAKFALAVNKRVWARQNREWYRNEVTTTTPSAPEAPKGTQQNA